MQLTALRKWISFCLMILLLYSLYFTLERFCYTQTDGLTLLGISSNRPFDPQWQTRSLSPEEHIELKEAFSQKYRYFGCGGQCYAFFSEDGKYALKFFKQKLYTIPLWHHLIPIPYIFDRYKEKKRWKRQDKIQRDFSSYKTAFEDLQELTGVVYVHLNRTDHLQQSITLIDRLHIEHSLDLDRFDFILQKRAEMIYPKLESLIQQDQIEPAKQIIDQIKTLILTRCQQGYEDWDPNIKTNCGLLANKTGYQAIKIDIGRFIVNPEMQTPQMCQAELTKILSPLHTWLKEQNSQLAQYCHQAMAYP